jgi:hypothetical protein
MRSAPVFLHAVLTPALAKSLAVEGTKEFALALGLLLYTRVQQAGRKQEKMALHMRTPSKVACSKRQACRPSPLVCKPNRTSIIAASSGQRASPVTSAVATTEAPTQQQQQQQQQEQRIASVSVNLGTAVEQVNVPLSDPNSRLVQAEIQFPLGLVIERECLHLFCARPCIPTLQPKATVRATSNSSS